MNNKKEIKKLEKVLFKQNVDYLCSDCGSHDLCRKQGKSDCFMYQFMAENLLEAGYGNVKQAVKEFAEKLRTKINDIPKDIFTSSIRQQELELIGELIKEIYGEG